MKTRHILYTFLAIVLLAGCKNYDTIRYSRATVLTKKQVAERIEEYDIFVHDDSGNTFRIKDPQVSEGKLIGKPVEIAESSISGDSLNDMHFYLNESEVVDVTEDSLQEFTNKTVRYVNMRGTDKTSKNKKVATGMLLALLLIPVSLVIGAIVIVSTSESSSNSQGSDSDSGGSGCYIATMSYGSYDAPQVLILREFRDRFLQKSRAGRAFIAWYYKNSPSFVEKHKNKKWLHSALRLPLDALVFVIRPFYSGRNAQK